MTPVLIIIIIIIIITIIIMTIMQVFSRISDRNLCFLLLDIQMLFALFAISNYLSFSRDLALLTKCLHVC